MCFRILEVVESSFECTSRASRSRNDSFDAGCHGNRSTPYPTRSSIAHFVAPLGAVKLSRKHIIVSLRFARVGAQIRLKPLDELFFELNEIKSVTLTRWRFTRQLFNLISLRAAQEKQKLPQAIKNYSEPFKVPFAGEDSLVWQDESKKHTKWVARWKFVVTRRDAGRDGNGKCLRCDCDDVFRAFNCTTPREPQQQVRTTTANCGSFR